MAAAEQDRIQRRPDAQAGALDPVRRLLREPDGGSEDRPHPPHGQSGALELRDELGPRVALADLRHPRPRAASQDRRPVPVQGRHDQEAAGPERLRHVTQRRVVVLDLREHLEGRHGVVAAVVERPAEVDEAQVEVGDAGPRGRPPGALEARLVVVARDDLPRRMRGGQEPGQRCVAAAGVEDGEPPPPRRSARSRRRPGERGASAPEGGRHTRRSSAVPILVYRALMRFVPVCVIGAARTPV